MVLLGHECNDHETKIKKFCRETLHLKARETLDQYIPYNYVKNIPYFLDKMIVVTIKLNYFQVALSKTKRVNYYKIRHLSYS